MTRLKSGVMGIKYLEDKMGVKYQKRLQNFEKRIDKLTTNDFEFVVKEEDFYYKRNIFEKEGIFLDSDKERYVAIGFSSYGLQDWRECLLNDNKVNLHVPEKVWNRFCKPFDKEGVDAIQTKKYVLSARLKNNIDIRDIAKIVYDRGSYSLIGKLEERCYLDSLVRDLEKIARHNVCVFVDIPEIMPIEDSPFKKDSNAYFAEMVEMVKEKLKDTISYS